MNSMSRSLFGRGIRRTGGPSNRTYLTSLVAALGVSLGGCSGGDSSDSSAASLDISVADVAGLPVGGAVVTVTAGRVQRQTTTGPDGSLNTDSSSPQRHSRNSSNSFCLMIDERAEPTPAAPRSDRRSRSSSLHTDTRPSGS